MNDEIKEILEHIKLYPEKMYCLSEKEKIILLDYITNLQQENEKLNKENEKWWAIIKDNEQEIKDLCLENSKLERENEELKKNQRYYKKGVFSLEYDKETMSDMIDDYKSRIEKAVEYLKERERNTNENIKTINMSRKCYIIEQEEVIDILNGRSDE